jgi:hypothetical protein
LAWRENRTEVLHEGETIMNIQTELSNPPEPVQEKWLTSPVRRVTGKLSEIRQQIPEFERRDFSLPEVPGESPRANVRLDAIVRRPFGDDKTFVPVGTVSKDYTLVTHVAVLDSVRKALKEAAVSAEETNAALQITEYGERMRLSVWLPDQYAFDPGDGEKMGMRFECLNSVDGSTRFRALMGWFRFVCSNGLVVGVTQSDLRRRHIGDLAPEDVGRVLASGLAQAETEKENFRKWRQRAVDPRAVTAWVDKDVREVWGFKAATRAYCITRSGHDAKIVGQYKGRIPTTIETVKLRRVPGTPTQSRNLFEVSQVLAWLAKERRDVQEQVDWREQIPGLLERMKK